MKKLTLPILILSLLMSSVPCFAGEQDKPEQQSYESKESYASKVGYKALNGFANITTAILEIPKNVINTTNNSNAILGPIGGLMKGIVNTFGRVIIGVTDLATAPIPTLPMAQPEYIWDDFDIDTSYGPAFRLKE